MSSIDSRIALVQRRLAGVNRVAWCPTDISRIFEHFGLQSSQNFQLDLGQNFRRDATIAIAPASKSTSNRYYTFTISTGSVDRAGDTIAVNGWNLNSYRKNPVVLWAHDASLLPVARTTSIDVVDGKKLKANVQFATADASPAGEQVMKLIAGGFLGATSVGFRPLEWSFSKDPARQHGIDFFEQELLEFSCVTVPANAECLIDPGQVGNKQFIDAKARANARRRREIDIMRLRSWP